MLVQRECARRYVVLAGSDRCAFANKPTEEFEYCDGKECGERQKRGLSSRATARMRSCRTLQREVIRPMQKISFSGSAHPAKPIHYGHITLALFEFPVRLVL